MNTGIDLKKLAEYITENYGKKCKNYEWLCPVCRAWELYDELEAFIETTEDVG